MPNSVFDLLQSMDAQNIILAYNGAVDDKLLEAVYSMMDKHLEAHKTPGDKKKKLFHVLVESLQNVFHHHADNVNSSNLQSGFIIKYTNEIYSIITGNSVQNAAIPGLTEKLEKINGLTPAELRVHYQESLAKTELSEKGGAGLGIIEMARKSGNKLKYEFTKVNDEFSFFVLEVTI